MRTPWIAAAAVALLTAGVSSQGKPVIVVKPFTLSQGVELPYDLKQLQGQMVAELRVMLSKDYQLVGEGPESPQGAFVYTLDGEITNWHPGNAAKRMLVGMGSGRESSDIQYRITDTAGKKVLEHQDTIRTNFYAQNGSTGTLAHPIAQKIADRIKETKLK